MSDDLTQKLPGEEDQIAPHVADQIAVLITAVQSLSDHVQALNTAVRDSEGRLEALEKTAIGNSLNTKPIWERALAEIAATRAELVETRAELKAELAETRTQLRAELAEMREDLKNEMNDGFRKLGSKLEVINEDLLTLRGNQRLLDRRVEALESKTP